MGRAPSPISVREVQRQERAIGSAFLNKNEAQWFAKTARAVFGFSIRKSRPKGDRNCRRERDAPETRSSASLLSARRGSQAGMRRPSICPSGQPATVPRARQASAGSGAPQNRNWNFYG